MGRPRTVLWTLCQLVLLHLLKVLLLLLLRQFDDVLLAGWTLLPTHEPAFETAVVEDVVTNGDLHQFFFLLEEAQTELALSLLHHVGQVARVIETVSFCVLISAVDHFVHDLEVHTRDGFYRLDVFTRIVVGELAVSFVLVDFTLSISRLLAVSQNEAY